MPREFHRETLTLSVKPGTKERLAELAERHGFFWGASPNPSALVSAFAAGELSTEPSVDLEDDQIRALTLATRALTEAGLLKEAKDIAGLITRSCASEGVRDRLIDAFSGGPRYDWRSQLEDLIADQRAFKVAYRGRYAKHQITLTVRFARIRFWNRAHYLEVWADESDERVIIPELAHNWQLRLDRVLLVTEESSSFSRDRLDFVEARLQIFGTLRQGYEPADDDIPFEDEPNGPSLGKSSDIIVRRVYFPFEFFKTVMSYGPDCEVLEPNILRDGVAQRLTKAAARY